MKRVLVVLLFVTVSVWSSVLRGVDPSKEHLYRKDVFTCLDKSKTIPFSAVNDDYCDCSDGSDEPGTSACIQGSFYCQNEGFVGSVIPSSHVDDGICDCCDGSDEIENLCPNTCMEKAKEQRRKEQRRTSLLSSALKVRSRYVEEAQRVLAVKRQELGQCKHEVAVLERTLNERKDEIEAVKAMEEGREKESKTEIESDVVEGVTDDEIGEEVVNETEEETQEVEDNDEEELEDDDEEVEDNDEEELEDDDEEVEEVEEDDEEEDEDDDNKDEQVEDNSDETITEKEEEAGTGEQTDESEAEQSLEEITREFVQSGRTLPQKLYDGLRRLLGRETENEGNVMKITKELAERIENDLKEKKEKCDKLEKELKEDYGGHDAMFGLREKKFEFSFREHTYVVTMYKDAMQEKSDSHIRVSNLGKWKKWIPLSDVPDVVFAKEAIESDIVDTRTMGEMAMEYDDGDTCWQGPRRSFKVVLVCGTQDKLIDVQEPSRCVYVGLFSTPAACKER